MGCWELAVDKIKDKGLSAGSGSCRRRRDKEGTNKSKDKRQKSKVRRSCHLEICGADERSPQAKGSYFKKDKR